MEPNATPTDTIDPNVAAYSGNSNSSETEIKVEVSFIFLDKYNYELFILNILYKHVSYTLNY